MLKITYKYLLPFLTIFFLIGVIGCGVGAYGGFVLGKKAICDDVAFYYNNDLPIKDCSATSKKYTDVFMGKAK